MLSINISSKENDDPKGMTWKKEERKRGTKKENSKGVPTQKLSCKLTVFFYFTFV